MSYQSLGHMPRAPLVYTVVMLEYAQVPAIASYAPLIQEELRREFPEILPGFSVNSVQINVDTIEKKQEFKQIETFHWAMNTADRGWGIVFSQNRLILQTSQYDHFNDFAGRFRRVIGVLAENADITHTTNVGIRYIDNIQVIDDLEISEQVGQGFLSPALTEEFMPELSRVEHVYRSSEGHLFLRCYGLQNHPGIPDDVRAMADQIFRGQAPMAPIMERFVLLDTDHIYTPNQLEPFDIDQIINRLDRLHKGASMAFRTAATKEALEAWGRES